MNQFVMRIIIVFFQLCKDSSKTLRDSKFYQFNMEQKLAEGALSSYHVCCRSYFECLRGGLGMLCVGQFVFLCLFTCLFIYIFFSYLTSFF